MSRQTFTVTVEVTAEAPPEDYRNSTLADDIHEAVQDAITEHTSLEVVVMTVTGTDQPTNRGKDEGIGRYKNRLGVELEVTGCVVDRNILGTIYYATIPDVLFGDRQVMITPAGLEECDYRKITQ